MVTVIQFKQVQLNSFHLNGQTVFLQSLLSNIAQQRSKIMLNGVENAQNFDITSSWNDRLH